MICTFYSYKGGVGRSMALANVAELCYQAGLRVLMVDWDLEAPGLERYFPSLDHDKLLDKPGLIEMLLEYKECMSQEFDDNAPLRLEGLDKYVSDVYSRDSSPGKLYLMMAGRRLGDRFPAYARAVSGFDWADFYRNWEGELYFEWLRRQFSRIADITLIDSRTGVTEMAGVCTYHLADTVVMFCAANQQSFDGTHAMARSFLSPEVTQLRGGRRLSVIIVPARIEDRAEQVLFRRFQTEFMQMFGEENFSPHSPLPYSVGEMWKLRIPHLPFYSFQEAVIVRDGLEKRHEDMYNAFLRLYLCLRSIDPGRAGETRIDGAISSEMQRISHPVLISREGNRYVLDEETMLIGRFDRLRLFAPQVDLSRESRGKTVSRQHARIALIGGQWLIEVLDTTSCTKVDNVDLGLGNQVPLADGAEIQLGGVQLVFHLGSQTGAD